MGLGYWLLSMFLWLFLIQAETANQGSNQVTQTTESEHQQRARQTVRYINAINDHLYAHPQDQGQLSNQVLGVDQVPALKHFIQDGRVFVFQKNQPGLMSALQTMTRDFALLGRVENRRLLDNRGADMQVAVPDLIPEDFLVYLN